MAQQFRRVLVALAEDPGSVPASTYLQTAVIPGPGDLLASMGIA